MTIDTETIDRLFLELSQFTKATTAKELALTAEVARLQALNACVTHLMNHPDDDEAYTKIAEAWLACNAQETP